MKKASEVISKAPILDKTVLPDNGTPRLVNSDTIDAIYRMVYLIYVPENPKGRGVIHITIPNKKEYNRVRRQLKRKAKIIRFYDEQNEPYVVQINPNTIAITLEKYITPKVKDGEKPIIVLPSSEAISKIN